MSFHVVISLFLSGVLPDYRVGFFPRFLSDFPDVQIGVLCFSHHFLVMSMQFEKLYLKVILLEQSKETSDFLRGVTAVRKLIDEFLDSQEGLC